MPNYNPIQNPERYDYFYVAGKASLLCEISGATRGNEWDVKRGKGSQGATVTYTGNNPSKFKAKLFLWEAAHWDQLDAFLPLLKYDPTKKVITAIDIVHPKLARLDINSVVTNDIGDETQETKDGLWSFTIEFLEFKKPTKGNASGTPGGSLTTSSGNAPPAGNVPPSAQDAQQAEIARLLKKAQEP